MNLDERDSRLNEAAQQSAQPAPLDARQRVWVSVKEPAPAPWLGLARPLVLGVAAMLFGFGLVLGWRGQPAAPELAPMGVSSWVGANAKRVTTCTLEATPCVKIKGTPGARFTLDTSSHIVRLAVQFGAVQVTDADGVVHQILASETAEFTHEAKGDLASAEAHLAQVASGSTLSAEAALYEQGVLRLRRRHDVEGALTLFTQWQARFPSGALAPEVALSRLEALEQLGRHREALEAATGFLRDFPENERASEVRRFEASSPSH